jgi:hypothetical protein
MLASLRRFVPIVALVLALPAAAQPPAPDDAAIARMKKDLFFLAGPECEGRGIGTTGLDKAADHVAAEFQKAGLKPAGKDGTFFQPFSVNNFPDLDGPTRIAFRGPEDKSYSFDATNVKPIGYSSGGKFGGGVAFVGHGIVAPNLKYDDYAGQDVKGKWVVIIRGTPRSGKKDKDRFDTTVPENSDTPYASLRLKFDTAVEKGAAGILFVSDVATAGETDAFIPFDRERYEIISSRLPVLHLKRSAASKVLEASLGKKLTELEAENDKSLKPVSTALTGWKAEAEVGVIRKEVPVKNVIGVLEGRGPLADETVVIGAHYDHLGYGDGPLSAGGSAAQGKPHYGADDNASGTTGLIELARRFGEMKDRRGRRIVFIAFTGEERGLLGSKYYCDHPAFPLAKTAAMVNLDMIGRLRPGAGDWLGLTIKPRMVIYGTGTGDSFDRSVDAAESRYGLKIFKIPGGIGRSDHESFYRKQVPVLFLFTGLHDEYHKPADTPDKIDLTAMNTVVGLTEDLLLELSSVIAKPKFQEQTGGFDDPLSPAPPRPGVRLGVRPDYAYMGADGMRIEGVTGGGAADKGGLKEGDVIVDIAGVPVRSVNGYMSSLVGKKPGDKLEVTVLRGGKKVKLSVVP